MADSAVLLVVLNHAGDLLTAKLAMRSKLKKLGIPVIHNHPRDIANAPAENSDDRRGLVSNT